MGQAMMLTPTSNAWPFPHPGYHSTLVQAVPPSYGPGAGDHAWVGPSQQFSNANQRTPSSPVYPVPTFMGTMNCTLFKQHFELATRVN